MKPRARLVFRIVKIGAGRTTLTMTVRPDLVNGQRIAPGGFIFALAESAFAFACNSRNQRAVGAQDSITFVKPRKLGDVLVANAKQISREPAVWHLRCAGHRGR